MNSADTGQTAGLDGLRMLLGTVLTNTSDDSGYSPLFTRSGNHEVWGETY